VNAQLPSAQEHVNRYAERFADELQPILNIDGITENTDLLGAYTEAALRNVIRRGFQPMHVCQGGILDYPQEKLAQHDIIIWAPYPAPAIFDVEGFGIVPRSSAFGVMEVKKSNYSDTDRQLEQFVTNIESKRLEAETKGMRGIFPTRSHGVIAALENNPSQRLAELIRAKQAVALFDLRDGRKNVRARDVVVLVNFLSEIL
jgi:hypothetical protein